MRTSRADDKHAKRFLRQQENRKAKEQNRKTSASNYVKMQKYWGPKGK